MLISITSTNKHASYTLSNGWRGKALSIGENRRISTNVLLLAGGLGSFVSGVTGTDIGQVEFVVVTEEADFTLDPRLWLLDVGVWRVMADFARRFTAQTELAYAAKQKRKEWKMVHFYYCRIWHTLFTCYIVSYLSYNCDISINFNATKIIAVSYIWWSLLQWLSPLNNYNLLVTFTFDLEL